MNKKTIQQYLAQDYIKRPIATFNRDVIAIPDLNGWNLERLAELSCTRRPLEKATLKNFLIDLSWKSSELEGNTYTPLDTQALIEYRQTAQGKPQQDAQMILNHASAIQYLMSLPWPASNAQWKLILMTINRLLLHQLDEEDRGGILRGYGEIMISQSSYIPTNDAQLLDQMLIQLNEIMQGRDPIEQSFLLFSRIPYLQLFFDGNKRLSRLLSNIPLLNNQRVPLSVIDIEKCDYIQAMLGFYELGDDSYLKEVFLSGYMGSVLRYQYWTKEQRIFISQNFEKSRQQMVNFVVGAEMRPDLLHNQTQDSS